MDVKLPQIQEEFIQRKIADGAFSSPDALISEGIRLLQQQENWLQEAGKKIEEGWQQAKSGMLLSEETLLQHLNTRKADWKSARKE